jgi:protein gp37
MNRTSIEWVGTYNEDGTFTKGYSVNPIRFRPFGSQFLTNMCQRCSPGCQACYAESITRRFWPQGSNVSFPGYTAQGIAAGEFVLDEKQLQSILKHKKPAKLFWGDMTDIFGEWVPSWMIDACFAP